MRIAPGERLPAQVVGQKNLLRSLPRDPLHSGRVKSFSFLKVLRLHEESLTFFQGKKINEMGRLVVGRREPIRAAAVAGTYSSSLGRGFETGADRPASRINSFRPG